MLTGRAGTTGRYSTGETPSIKAERPVPSDYLRSTCTRVNTIYEDLNESSSARLGGSQQLEILPSPHSKRGQNFSAWVLIGAEILMARQFCWRSNFTRCGDFMDFVFRRSFPQKFSAKAFGRSFPQQISACILRQPPQFFETLKFHVFVIF